MSSNSAQVRCYTYPSRRALLEQWAKEDGVSLSAYFRNVIKDHLRRLGWVDTSVIEQKAGFVYLIRFAEYHKIGRAFDVRKRLLAMCLPEKPVIVAVRKCVSYAALEKHLHSLFLTRRKNGEWFVLSPEQVEEAKTAMLQWPDNQK